MCISLGRPPPSPLRVRRRFAFEARELATTYAGTLWAAERWYGRDSETGRRVHALRETVEQEFGLKARLSGPVLGTAIRAGMALEGRRLRRGWTYEPPTFFEANDAAAVRPEWQAALRGAWVEAAAASRSAEGVAARVALDEPALGLPLATGDA